MLSAEQTNILIDYWYKSSTEKLKTMESLYKAKRYADCLFFGHLVLEKILKAIAVKMKHEAAPYSHNLIYLAKISNLELNEKETKLLIAANEFNLQTRYPDEKLGFYQICTKAYVDEFYEPIIFFYKKLCLKLK